MIEFHFFPHPSKKPIVSMNSEEKSTYATSVYMSWYKKALHKGEIKKGEKTELTTLVGEEMVDEMQVDSEDDYEIIERDSSDEDYYK